MKCSRKRCSRPAVEGRTKCARCLQLRADAAATVRGRVLRILSVRRRDARDQGRAFAITIADLAPFPSVCPLLGVPLDYAVKGGRPAPNSPSIDCINPAQGYVPGNVWIVSFRANALKGDGTWQEHEAISRALWRRVTGFVVARRASPSPLTGRET